MSRDSFTTAQARDVDRGNINIQALLDAEVFAEWQTQIERFDALARTIRSQAERDEFAFVAQAMLSLRLRGNDENRFLVRDELSAEGAPLEIRNERVGAAIASVQNGLREK